jgi:hypothetical protein
MIEHVFDSDAAVAEDLVQGLRARLEVLAGEDRSGWAGASLSELVVGLAGVVERAEAELVRVVGEWDAVGAWELDGAVTPASWLAARIPRTRPEAVTLVRSARLVRQHARTGKALAAGDISVSHVTTMSRAERGRRDSFADDEDMLLDLAPELRPTEFVTAMGHWCHVVDDERRKRDPNAKFDQRFLDLQRTFDGHANVDGFLDQEAAQILENALAKIMGPPDPRNGLLPPRTARQRRADALVDMARESLAHATPGGHVPAHVAAVLHVNDALDQDCTDHNHDDDARADKTETPPGPSRNRAQRRRALFGRRHTVNLRPATRKLLERLCCDASIARVVMDGESEVLDLGRERRIPTAAQFRALVLRDQHCQFPGCDRPPEWTDAHHLIHWLHRGTTDLDNLVLVCRYHHVKCHEGGWTLHREPDGKISATPPPDPWERPPPRGSPFELAA